MIKWLKNSARYVAVTVGIIVLTSFSIDATDTLRGSQTALGILANKVVEGACPADMVIIDNGDKRFCLDTYEVSPGINCPYQKPGNISETAINISDVDCLAVSTPQAMPWTFVAKPQAEQLCAKSQKKLPTASEWYQGSLGTSDSRETCNLTSNLSLTGSFLGCRSGAGVYDMIGNVWELIDASVSNGTYNERTLPDEGYVEQVDESGIATITTIEPNDIYNQDYFWSSNDTQVVMMRGGFYGSRADGGIYATHAQNNQNFASAAVGFRCAKSL